MKRVWSLYRIAIAAAIGVPLCMANPGVGLADTSGHGERPIGVSLDPLFNLTTQHGERLTRADLKGRPFIVLFGYTSCADICPTALSDLSFQLQKLGAEADRLRVVFVTVDPDRDTVAHLRTYLESFDGRIVGVTGSIGDIRQVAAALGAAFARGDAQESGYSVDHSYRMFLFDRYGLLTKTVGYKEQDALASLSRRLLAQ